MNPSSSRLTRFARFSWAVLAYNLVVIAWGAFVRATGSGAGCGSHWPLCNGEVIPRAPDTARLIEFTHRVTSGIALVLVMVMAIWAYRVAPPKSLVRRGALLSAICMLAEAGIGAGLVLLEHVAHNASLRRGASMMLHLTNTFFLLAALSLTAFWAAGGPTPRLRKQGALIWVLAIAFLSVILLGTSGAVAALGDTLFPAQSLREGLAQDLSSTSHLFLRVRALHPALAMVVGVYLVVAASLARFLRPSAQVHRWSRIVTVLFLTQFALGLLNIVLLAPVAIQLAHLVLADSLWIALVLLAAHSLDESISPSGSPQLNEQGHLGTLAN